MTDRERYYVSLTASCDAEQLPEVLADMQAAMIDLTSDGEGHRSPLDGLSLSFTRSDDDMLSGELTDAGALPTALPEPGQHVAEQILPTAPVPTDTDGISR